ncbi:asparaginase [Litchfieldia salsa]|uniref:asparaginase n=1 Tax=Litchfieldia salsa TaxID=930152 RepID=A0A1H0WGT9_9BACI|nr:asparaginase [Litchfieldia salsa]SDP89516.1 asparaginase [Litchfieldia salsa]
MKKILLIHTGGTISMKEDKTTGTVQQDQENPLLSSTNNLSSLADITVIELFHLPSPHITTNEMLILMRKVKEIVKLEKIEGVVITHGTDTLEETAYFLDLTLPFEIPIVVTGAMRSSNELGADGLYNLISSIKVAACDSARGKGVLVVLNDEIHTARNVTKTHTSNVATFQSPQYGPIGIVTKRGVTFYQTPIHRQTYNIESLTKNVIMLKAYAGMDGALLKAARDIGVDGLVIEALGQGNLPPAMIQELNDLIEKQISVVLVSRCFNGFVEDIYSYEGGGKHLKDLGVIFSNGLNGQKARLKLLVALENNVSQDGLHDLFQK